MSVLAEGLRGPAGADGAHGRHGRNGAPGVPGRDGKPGAKGADGMPGPKGDRGDPGPQGEIGPQGPQGERGEAGEPGPRGEQGLPGRDGADGVGIADIALQGDSIAILLTDGRSFKGKLPRGPKGERGEAGPAGRDGRNGGGGGQGEEGPAGADGAPGAAGADGAPGADGLILSPTIGAFTAQTGTALGAVIESNSASVAGDAGTIWPVVVRGEGSPEIEVNGDGVWSPYSAVRNGDTLKVRLTSAGSGATQRVATVYAQGGSQAFSVTTAAGAIESFSQSSNFGGAGVQAASLINMQDGLAEPFAATNDGGNEWVRMTLESSSYVTGVIIRASTNTNGWGSPYLNGRKLQRSDDNGDNWTDVTTLSGFTNSSEQTVTVNANCTDLRLLAVTGWLAVGEFKLA